MAREWTKSQRDAIKSRGENLLLAAGAGSGKTAVLTERIAQLASDGTPLENMLVVTFTRSAAAEMRQRIQSRLEDIARGDGDEEAQRRARQQLADFSQANISTLHSFCQNVLRRHFHEADVDPGFRVGDELECRLLREDALEVALERAYRRDEEEGEDRVAALTATLTDGGESVEELLLRCYNMMMALPDPWAWLERSLAAYEMDYEGFCSSELWQGYMADCRKSVDECLIALEAIEEYMRQGTGYTDKFLASLDSSLGQARALRGAFSGDTAEIPGIDTWPDLRNWRKDRPEEVQILQKKAKEIYEKKLPRQFSPRAHWEAMGAALPVLRTLAQLLEDFHESYNVLKRSKALVDFSDLEHKTLTVLKQPQVAREYRQRFAAVFVDEYQDTNRVQEDIVNRISEPGSLFVVGDIKQSIYRFRAADPFLFRSRAQRYAQGEEGRRIDLRENFRSAPNVLSAVNDVFLRAMPLSQGEVDYGEQEMLLPGQKDRPEGAAVTLNIFLSGGEEDNGESGEEMGEEERSSVQRQAAHVAREIRRRLGSDIYDGGEMRPFRYGDCVILLRTGRGAADEVARSLAQEGVPAYTAISGGYFDAVEVQVLVNLLKLIDNRRQDIPLLSVMRAGLFGFTDADLPALRQQCEEPCSIYEAFEAACTREGELGDRCRELNAFLLEGRRRSRAMSVDKLIEWALVESQYDLLTAALPGGPQRTANLRVLTLRARSYEGNAAGGLRGFMRYLERLTEAGMELGEAVLNAEGSDAVRVMTMHSSKGLEFPVVFILNLEKQFNRQDERKKLLLHRDLGMGAQTLNRERRIRRKTLLHERIAQRMAQETRAEELRMLYVAMTRAKEELHMYASVKRNKKGVVNSGRWREAGKQNSLLDFLLYALLDTPVCKEFRIAIDEEAGMPTELAAHWQLRLLGEEEQSQARQEQAREDVLRQWEGEARQTDYRELAQRYDWRYAGTPVAGKVTVSALASGRQHFDESPRFMEQRRMTAEDRGQALHSILEHLDWQGALDEEGLAAQIQSMEAGELITPEQSAVVNPAIVARFARSPLGLRMQGAQELRRELPFTVLLPAKSLGLSSDSEEEVVLQGVIDACFLEEGKWVLVDYKSDRVPDDSPEGLTAAAEKHREQIGLYARALELLSGREVGEAYIFLLSVGEAVAISLDGETKATDHGTISIEKQVNAD